MLMFDCCCFRREQRWATRDDVGLCQKGERKGCEGRDKIDIICIGNMVYPMNKREWEEDSDEEAGGKGE
jgi:hypothetical protein